MRFAVLVVSTLFAVGLLGPAASAAELRQGQVQLSQSSPGTPTSRLVARGDDLMAIGDISAARLLYETAASQGDAVAAAKLGMTYDPIELSAKGVVGMVGDPETAAKWYRLAVDRGYNPAASSLAALQNYMQSENPTSRGRATTREPSPPEPQNRIPANQDGVRTQEANKPAVLGVSERLDAGNQVVKPEGGTGELRVQLAALQSRQAAIEQGVELQVRHWDLIGSKVLSIERLALSENRGTMYGIQIGPFWDIGSATNLCTELKTQGQDCFVVP